MLSEYRGGIQKRHYYNAVFATAPMEGCDSSIDAMWRGLLPLHLYRHGIPTYTYLYLQSPAAGDSTCGVAGSGAVILSLIGTRLNVHKLHTY